MFTFKALKQARKMRNSTVTARPSRSTIRLWLEELEDRTLLSASPLPAVFEASPPAAASVAAITSYMFSMMERTAQWIATIEQNVIGAYEAVGQEIYSVEQRWDSFFAIDPSSPNASPSIAASRPGNAMGHNVSNPSTTGAMPSPTAGGG